MSAIGALVRWSSSYSLLSGVEAVRVLRPFSAPPEIFCAFRAHRARPVWGARSVRRAAAAGLSVAGGPRRGAPRAALPCGLSNARPWQGALVLRSIRAIKPGFAARPARARASTPGRRGAAGAASRAQPLLDLSRLSLAGARASGPAGHGRLRRRARTCRRLPRCRGVGPRSAGATRAAAGPSRQAAGRATSRASRPGARPCAARGPAPESSARRRLGPRRRTHAAPGHSAPRRSPRPGTPPASGRAAHARRTGSDGASPGRSTPSARTVPSPRQRSPHARSLW